MDDPLVLHQYDPNWPKRFLEEEQAVSDLLGEEVIAIHHVGSTSVPGLLAKSIIDIALEIRQYPPSQALIEALASIGYEHMGESGVRGRHWFRKGRPRSFHIHAAPENGEVARAQVQLRDFLRKHPEAAKEYEDIKKLNAEGKTIDSAEYAAAKGYGRVGFVGGFGRFEACWIHDQVADIVGADPAGITFAAGLCGQ
ncbi:MAG: GrpB family protein [Chloroflexota bacterium]